MDNWPIYAAAGWALFLGVVGGLLTPLSTWYFNLKKPAWQPPDWLFGPAWTVILGLGGWSAANAWYAAGNDAERQAVVILFAVNGVCHLLWSPLFFKLRRPDWALVEVVFLWASLLALIVGLWQISVLSSLLILPYFAWVSFAAVLNRAIVRLNGPFGR
ncbi:MAG: TspO protein [Proteobacteria bacterium SG_bin6]|nr:MAG: TspO protein [Proteobacteria bacterium SG_bin6]